MDKILEQILKLTDLHKATISHCESQINLIKEGNAEKIDKQNLYFDRYIDAHKHEAQNFLSIMKENGFISLDEYLKSVKDKDYYFEAKDIVSIHNKHAIEASKKCHLLQHLLEIEIGIAGRQLKGMQMGTNLDINI